MKKNSGVFPCETKTKNEQKLILQICFETDCPINLTFVIEDEKI